MFGFRREVRESLEYVELLTSKALREVRSNTRQLRIIMSNQEVFDAYAAQIAEQNSQIRSAVDAILLEVNRLQAEAVARAEKPLDTSKMEQAIQQLTAAVDSVEAIPAPVAVEEPVAEVPVEVVEEPVVETVEETPVVEQTVEDNSDEVVEE